MARVFKLEIAGPDGRTFRKYGVLAGNLDPENGFFDITRELEKADKEDRDATDARETGWRFGFAVHNALKAAELQHAQELGWRQAGGPEGYRPKLQFAGFWKSTPDKVKVLRTWSWPA